MHGTFIFLFVGILSYWPGSTRMAQAPAPASQTSFAAAEARAYDDPQAYDVYTAALVAADQLQEQHPRKIIIREEAEPYKMCIHPEGESARQITPAMADYARAIATPWRLQKKFKLADYELVAQSVLDALLKNNPQGWQEFRYRYTGSNGYVEFSPVGFNPDKTVAVVYMGQHCGNLCGSGQMFVMQKSKHGKWLPMEWEGEHCFWNR